MIDPINITDFHRDDAALEEFWLFCCVVPNKPARQQAVKLDAFLALFPPCAATPFAKILHAYYDGSLRQRLVEQRFGQYERLYRCFYESASLDDLRHASVADLEGIHGVGPKTARLFLMHSRPNQRYAALDTHVLKHLRANGIDAPTMTPSGRRYAELEAKFLELADQSGMSPADFDLAIWRLYSTSEAIHAKNSLNKTTT